MSDQRFFLFGDSHIGCISRGSRLTGMSAIGRATMRGRLWYEGRFELRADGHLDVEDEGGRQRLAESLAEAGARTLFDLEIPIVTTVPFVMEAVINSIGKSHGVDVEDREKAFLSSALLKDLILTQRRKILDLLARLHTPQREVIVVSPPPRAQPLSLAVAVENIVIDELSRLGIRTHHTRGWSTGPDGFLLPPFLPDKEEDLVHANRFYGAYVMDRVAPMLGIEKGVGHETRILGPGAPQTMPDWF